LPVAARAQLAPGTASAAAARAGELVAVSRTGASAAPTTSNASASVLEVGGKPAFGLGGSQTGDGDDSGALLDTESRLPLRLELAPWQASVSGSAGPERRTRASAAAARAGVPGVARAAVLQSNSEASHRSERSRGSASSHALELGLLDKARIVLLHSEVGSEGKGRSHLASVNGTEVGSDEQLGAVCALDASPLVSASCLTATGGIGAAGQTSGAAELLAAQSAVLPVTPLAAFAAQRASGSSASPLAAAAPAADTTRPQPAAVAPAQAAAAPAQPAAAPAQAAGEVTKALARTGAMATILAAIALLAAVSGMALRLAARRSAP
jgi:2-oxoglutarate dehydrogenase E2 component (dihydrolipoamide succinyltransferase)